MKSIIAILGSARQLWPYYAGIGAFTVLLSLVNLMQPLLTGWVIDELRKGDQASVRYVALIAAAIFAIDLLVTLFSNISGYLGDQMSLKLNRILARRYYDHILKLPQSYFDNELTGTIINRLNRSINQITDFIQMMSNTFLQFIFTTIFTLGIVAYYSWQVALLMLSIYPVYIWLTARTSSKWQVWQTDINAQFDIAHGRFAEAINQVKVVKSFLRERSEIHYFDRHYKQALALNRPQSAYWHRHDVYRRIALGLIFFGMYLFIFVQGAQGKLSPGAVVTLILYSMQIRIPIFTISMLVDRTQRAVADSRDYFKVMELQPGSNEAGGSQELSVTEGSVEFSQVTFGYASNDAVLKDVTLKIHARTKVALVGESGEGKTTLTNLLLGLYRPQSGRICIDGQEIGTVTQQSLRSAIGVVFQEPALFSGTIRENIAYGRPDAPEAEIIAAAKAANAHEFITKLEKQYDAQIGERGVRLSGGQKQRIAIARALLKDAPILILDEATSSLDSRSEQMVHQALERLMKNRTTIIIAHRLSTIQHVDQIVTLKKGSIDESGSPEELASTGGIYAQLLRLQQQSAGSAKEKRLKAYDLAEE